MMSSKPIDLQPPHESVETLVGKHPYGFIRDLKAAAGACRSRRQAMHQSSFDKMRDFRVRFLKESEKEPMRIVDIGSMDVNGTYRSLFGSAALGSS